MLMVILGLSYAGAHLSAQDSSAAATLAKAVCHGNVRIVNALLAAGAMADAMGVDDSGLLAKPVPCLELAFRRGNIPMCECLLAARANPCASAPGMPSFLHLVAASGPLELLAKLVSMGACVTLPDACQGWPPLHHAAANGNIDSVNLLLQSGVEVDCHATAGGESPLALAAGGGHKLVVETLISHGAKVDVTESAPEAIPLHRACLSGCADVVQVLLSAGADARRAAADGSMPMHAAARSGSVAVVKALLEHGT